MVDFDNGVVECLYRYDIPKGVLYGASIDVGFTNPSFMFPMMCKCCKNRFVVSIDRTLIIVIWDGYSPVATYARNVTFVEQDEIFDGATHFDRGKVDPFGRLYAGTYRLDNCAATSSPNGSLFLFEKNNNGQVLIPNIRSTTGLAFNKSKGEMYFLDNCVNYITAYHVSSNRPIKYDIVKLLIGFGQF